MGVAVLSLLISAPLALLPATARAQGNFAIQVYGSETVEGPGATMVELHSNSAIMGTTTVEDGEAGYQERRFSPDTWTLEIRPIIDKQIGPWYFPVNPAFEQSLKGPGTKTGIEFTPAAKVSYDLTKVVSPGIEYYGTLGPVGNFPPTSQQQQQLYAVVDLNVDPRREINVGAPAGLTHGTDRLIIKLILGRRC